MKRPNRYFSCTINPALPRQFLTVSASQAERVQADPRYQSEDPVREFAYRQFAETIYGQSSEDRTIFSFKEHPQEEGDRMLNMEEYMRPSNIIPVYADEEGSNYNDEDGEEVEYYLSEIAYKVKKNKC